MDFETGKSIIDTEIPGHKFSQNYLEFFGGEPLLNFPLIKALSEYVWMTYPDDIYKVTFCTNGTQFTNEVKEWILENKSRLEIGVSLDGKKGTQDYNRSDSYDLIDYDFVKSLGNVIIKMTISYDRLEHLAEDVIFLHTLKDYYGSNLDADYPWPNDERTLQIFAEQLQIIEEFYLKNDGRYCCSLLNAPIDTIMLSSLNYVEKNCGAGTTAVTYSVEGKRYPCQGFVPICFDGNDLNEIVLTRQIPVTKFDEKCQRCIYLPCCPGCYATNYIKRGSVYSRDLNMCKFIHLIFKASSHYRFQHIKSHPSDYSDKEKSIYLHCIKKIMSFEI